MATFRAAFFQLFLLLMIPLSFSNPIPSFSSYLSCVKMCQCSLDEEGRVFARCSFTKHNITATDVQLPPKVYSL